MRCSAMLLVLLALSACPAIATTYLVKPDGTGDYPTIQEAIDAAVEGDVIELADGQFVGEGNRDVDFLGKAITVRSFSGDPVSCTINCAYLGRGMSFVTGEDSLSVLEGITISAGYVSDEDGAGVLCSASSPTIENCIFSYCSTGLDGGGLTVTDGSNPSITRCKFAENVAFGRGGAIYCTQSTMQILDCTFESNSAHSRGGGLYCHSSDDLLVAGCAYLSNSTLDDGGALYLSECNSSISQTSIAGSEAVQDGGAIVIASTHLYVNECEFAANAAGGDGGAIYGGGWLEITHTTFRGNSARYGGALYMGSDSLNIANCTFQQNAVTYSGGAIRVGGGFNSIQNTIISHSVTGEAVFGPIQEMSCCNLFNNAGGDWINELAQFEGVAGNISEDPLYCDPDHADLHLQETSPCAPFTPPNVGCDLVGALPVGCGSSYRACCLNDICEVLQEEDCIAAGGEWLSETEGCQPNPCAYSLWHVEADGSGDFPTIQDAINVAVDGDSIVLGDGVFLGEGNRNIDFLGKAITVCSESRDPEDCGFEAEPH